jgi:ubiquinone/menaquinone biosynthesis C-methylase UbiE
MRSTLAVLAAPLRRLRARRVNAAVAPAASGRRAKRPGYGEIWVPRDETQAMDLILNVTDAEEFEKAGRREAEEVLAPLIRPTDTVLDLGCGIGRVVRYVAPLCSEIWAVDVSERMLELARQRLRDVPNVRFALGGGRSLPEEVPSASVDLVYSLLTLQHVEREHAFMLLRDVRRVLRDGGRAYLTFPNLLSDTYLDHFVEYSERDETGNPARARFYTPQEVERVLPAAGFVVEQIDTGVEICVTCRTG